MFVMTSMVAVLTTHAALVAKAPTKIDLFVPSPRFPCFRQPAITVVGDVILVSG
jgi:hypothetical protein